MQFSSLLLASLVGLGSATPLEAAATAAPNQPFNLTALGAANGKSTIECWQLAAPLIVSTDPRTAGILDLNLGPIGKNATYNVVPPNYDAGLHTAPGNQFVLFISGLAELYLPDSNVKAVLPGGPNSLIIATDTASVSQKGHGTRYPGKTKTVALQIPFKDGVIPQHKVLHSGQCTKHEQTVAN